MKIQRSIALAAVAGLATGSLAQSAGQLDGTWTAVSAERDGKPADELKSIGGTKAS